MKVIEPGHIYELDHLDGKNKSRLTFVNRESAPHEGTQTQEVLRANIDSIECLIDRTNHCDACLRWEGNDRIIKAMSEAQRQLRLALLIHEERALERKLDKGKLKPEEVAVGTDGHFQNDGKSMPRMQNRWEARQDQVIEIFPISSRLRNSLKRSTLGAGVTLREFSRIPDDELLKIKNFGMVCLKELRDLAPYYGGVKKMRGE